MMGVVPMPATRTGDVGMMISFGEITIDHARTLRHDRQPVGEQTVAIFRRSRRGLVPRLLIPFYKMLSGSVNAASGTGISAPA